MTQDQLKEIVEHEDRELRKVVRAEIERQSESKYWRVPPGEFHITEPEDFDHIRMAKDLAPQYPHLPIEAIHSAIIQSIGWLHM